MEWDYGAHEGRTTEELRIETPGWSVWDVVPRAGESVSDVAARADRVIDRVLGQTGLVALFAHGHLLRILAARWLGLPAACGKGFELATASVSVLGFEREHRVIRRWNDIGLAP
jgi:broad specificity phosphatase PhoE